VSPSTEFKIPKNCRIFGGETLELLQDRKVSLAMISWDGCRSVFWLVKGDPATDKEAENFWFYYHQRGSRR